MSIPSNLVLALRAVQTGLRAGTITGVDTQSAAAIDAALASQADDVSQHIIIHGNPVAGFDHIGPFDCMELAHDHASANYQGDWWIKELIAPPIAIGGADAVDTSVTAEPGQLAAAPETGNPLFSVAVAGAAMSPIIVRASCAEAVHAVVPDDADVTPGDDTAPVDFDLPADSDAVVAFYAKRFETLQAYLCDLPGYDSTEATEHLQLRVMGPSIMAVREILGPGANCFFIVGANLSSEEVDYVLPSDESALRAYVANPTPKTVASGLPY